MSNIINEYMYYKHINDKFLEEGVVEEIFGYIKDNIGKMYKSFSTWLSETKKKLTNNNVSINKITNIAKSTSNKYVKLFKKNIDNKKDTVSDMKKMIVSALKSVFKILSKLSMALVILALVVTINTAMMLLFSKFVGSYFIATYLAAIFIAPLTEETAKRLSIIYKFDYFYMPLFSWSEFFLYMKHIVGLYSASIPIIMIGILVRLIAVLFHYLTYFYQREELKKDPDEKRSYYVSILIHSSWNAIGPALTYAWLAVYSTYKVIHPSEKPLINLSLCKKNDKKCKINMYEKAITKLQKSSKLCKGDKIESCKRKISKLIEKYKYRLSELRV